MHPRFEVRRQHAEGGPARRARRGGGHAELAQRVRRGQRRRELVLIAHHRQSRRRRVAEHREALLNRCDLWACDVAAGRR